MKLVVLFQIQKEEMRCQKCCKLQRELASVWNMQTETHLQKAKKKANKGHYKYYLIFTSSLNQVQSIFDEPIIKRYRAHKTTFSNQLNKKKKAGLY